MFLSLGWEGGSFVPKLCLYPGHFTFLCWDLFTGNCGDGSRKKQDYKKLCVPDMAQQALSHHVILRHSPVLRHQRSERSLAWGFLTTAGCLWTPSK